MYPYTHRTSRPGMYMPRSTAATRKPTVQKIMNKTWSVSLVMLKEKLENAELEGWPPCSSIIYSFTYKVWVRGWVRV